MKRAYTGIQHLPVTDDPAYNVPAGMVAVAMSMSRAALYKRRDLIRLAKRKNGRARWRRADLVRIGADLALLKAKLVRASVMEAMLDVSAGYLEENDAPCHLLPNGDGPDLKRYDPDAVMAWLAKHTPTPKKRKPRGRA